MKSTFETHRDKIDELYLCNGCNFATPHFHHHIELLFSLDDGLPITLNGEKFILNKNETAIFDCFDVHSIDNFNNKYRSISLIIPWRLNLDYIKTMTNMKFENPIIRDEHCNESIKKILTIMEENITNIYMEHYTITTYDKKLQPFFCNLISALINIIFYYSPRVPSLNSAIKDKFHQILFYIEDNYDEPLTLNSLANTFGYNACYFSKLWKKTFNCGCNEYINSVRLEKLVKHYSQNESLTSLAISHGFNSLRSMERNFKAKYGITPKEFFSN